MPITFRCADKKVEKLYTKHFTSFKSSIEKSLSSTFPERNLLRLGRDSEYSIYNDILENGTPGKNQESTVKFNRCNGFVYGAISAYNNHNKLEISPDVYWLTIIAQFNYFQQRFAEEMRELYVSHEGKKTLTVSSSGSIHTFSADEMIDLFTSAIKDNIKDGEFVHWVQPNFTTTTPLDLFVSGAMLMSTMQKYFDFRFELECGIPEYTILGEKADWEKIMDKLRYFDVLHEFLTTKGCKEYKGELRAWNSMLKEVTSHFIKAFDGDHTPDFWNCICAHYGGGSGPSYTSGWISVFNCFNSDGKYIGSKFSDSWRRIENSKWPIINDNDLVNAVTTVPVIIDDNGICEYTCTLFAGIFRYVTDKECETVIPETNYVLICDKKKDL